MDIKKFAVEPTTRLHLRDAGEELMYAAGADGKPDQSRPMAVTLYGPGSKPYARAQAKQSNRIVDKLKRKGKSEQTAEERATEQAEFLTMCTVGFENVEYDGLEGDALAKAIYSDVSIGFIAEQVAKHLGDWANFWSASTKASDSTSSKAPG
jgi:hypothetical protein